MIERINQLTSKSFFGPLIHLIQNKSNISIWCYLNLSVIYFKLGLTSWIQVNLTINWMMTWLNKSINWLDWPLIQNKSNISIECYLNLSIICFELGLTSWIQVKLTINSNWIDLNELFGTSRRALTESGKIFSSIENEFVRISSSWSFDD